ncbi:MAG: hypothetical protein EHM45_01770 [Desulfobacteraceae bacterium]|nr:MAG: hypothetical protein EHM45_01770 [Desulfobacteraceae bacterium]
MTKDRDDKIVNESGVDESLIAAFIRMSPEERLLANDRMVQTILELRDAFKRRKTDESEFKPGS